MIITIAILSFLGMIFSLIDHAYNKGTLDCNLFFPAILTIVLWNTNITLAILTIVVTALIAIIGFLRNS
jgi:hypothetical protein